MADEKDKKKEEGEDGKKKGLPPIVLVAVGAALGGAGTVFMLPTPEPDQAAHVPEVPEIERVLHPDAVEHNFNPRNNRSKAMAQIHLKFIYKTYKDDADAAHEEIKQHWEIMRSKVLFELQKQSPDELLHADNRPQLEKVLRETMTLSLFPAEDGEKTGIAVVDEVLITKLLVN